MYNKLKKSSNNKQEIIDNLDKEIDENIGLKNVHQRLKLLYGEGLKITKLKQGTATSILPFVVTPRVQSINKLN